ncbi:acetamidase/formamidase family protein [Planococcus salinus]|uniref:Formamidase n=1 Tax=Planococcus salinus TaxID=1848460 RepID=A0A3M8P9L2_9BACL|nr:acetamidase/formamidase family protein [Planococcus salinus]RNF40302.1 formamidase [Planococcus salinus]
MKVKTSLLSATSNSNYHTLSATPDTVHWGFFDKNLKPALTIDSGDLVYVETVTHHAGDAPDVLMDDGIEAIYQAIPEDDRKPGPHLLTGPIEVRGAKPGDVLEVQILSLEPRLPYGSNLAAPWGYLADDFNNEERVTIYKLDTARQWLTAEFAYDYPGDYNINGRILQPEEVERVKALQNVQVPARLHVGTIGVAPAENGPIDTTPPDTHGGNVDNWQIGAGATMFYPVHTDGALLSLGDSHLAQGNGELSGTGVEASLNCLIRVVLRKDLSLSLPVLETEDAWMIHAFDPELDEAVRIGSHETLKFLETMFGMSREDSYSYLSTTADIHITQVVNQNKGIHITLPKKSFLPKT